VKHILIENGFDPEPNLTRKTTWKEFIRSDWNILAACGFFSVEPLVKGEIICTGRPGGRCQYCPIVPARGCRPRAVI